MQQCGNQVNVELDEPKEELNSTSADYIKMDYDLKTPEERNEKVKEILANTPSERLTSQYLHRLAKYIVEPTTREERKEQNRMLLTSNRLKTVNEREISFEGLVGKLENGEDGIYSMIANDKNIIFKHNDKITQEDIDNIPPLKQLCEAIAQVQESAKHARGKRAYAIGKQLIEMYRDQYVIRDSYRHTIKMKSVNLIKSMPKLDLSEKITIDENYKVTSNSLISLFNDKHISILLCNYSKIKEDSWDKFQSDIKWLMEDLDNLIDKTFKENYPMYYDLIIYKIDGKQNIEIQDLLYADYGVKHSVEYISSLWRNKIPKMIAGTAEKEYLIWYYTTQEKGHWKKCSRCGQIKLACNAFFSKNKTSKDGWYSICKECRNKKPNQIKLK